MNASFLKSPSRPQTVSGMEQLTVVGAKDVIIHGLTIPGIYRKREPNSAQFLPETEHVPSGGLRSRTTVHSLLGKGARSRLPEDVQGRWKATILLVAHALQLRDFGNSVMTDDGYRVVNVTNGEQGLKVFGLCRGKIDLVVTDIQVSGGIEMIKHLRAEDTDVKVIYISGYRVSESADDQRLASEAAIVLLQEVARMLKGKRSGKRHRTVAASKVSARVRP